MERYVDNWEYLTTVLEADATANGAERYLLERYPGRDYPKFAPESLTPTLNRLGRDGWELLSLQPVFLGKNGDVMVPSGQQLARGSYYTRQYLCVFKRRSY